MAGDDEVERLWPEIYKILEILGHTEALVTDESKIWDFTFFCPEKVREISDSIGFKITENDYLIDIAKKIKRLN